MLQDVKSKRLQEIIHTFRTNVQLKNEQHELHRIRLVLVEGLSSKNKCNTSTNASSDDNTLLWSGRTDQNKRILFPYQDVVLPPTNYNHNTYNDDTKVSFQIGDYIAVLVTEVRGHTLRGRGLWRSTLQSFKNDHANWIKMMNDSSSSVNSLHQKL